MALAYTVTLSIEILSEYSGVLISDFYSGFNALKCEQQKCRGKGQPMKVEQVGAMQGRVK